MYLAADMTQVLMALVVFPPFNFQIAFKKAIFSLFGYIIYLSYFNLATLDIIQLSMLRYISARVLVSLSGIQNNY